VAATVVRLVRTLGHDFFSVGRGPSGLRHGQNKARGHPGGEACCSRWSIAGRHQQRARLDAAPRQVTGQRYASLFHRVKPSPPRAWSTLWRAFWTCG
jgi:hypothetical protein